MQVLFIQSYNHLFAQGNNAKSIAIILKISGNNKQISNTEVASFKIYNGSAKNLNKNKPVKSTDLLKIKVLNELNDIIYEGYYSNPLNQNLESFEESGEVNNNIIYKDYGFVNIRLSFQGNPHSLLINTYTFKNEEEILSSTYKLKIQ